MDGWTCGEEEGDGGRRGWHVDPNVSQSSTRLIEPINSSFILFSITLT
jgi:hypothetical protein